MAIAAETRWVRPFWNDAEPRENSGLASWLRENGEDRASFGM